MNKRIKYLAERARGQMAVLTTVDDEQWRQHEEFVRKFAELIVKECEQVSLKNSHRDDDMGSIIARQIKQHFGVEE